MSNGSDIKFRFTRNESATYYGTLYEIMNSCEPYETLSLLDYTVERYTGRVDKNGIEIYEGDFVEYEGERLMVRWSDSIGGFVLFGNEGYRCLYNYEPHLTLVVGSVRDVALCEVADESEV